MSDNNNCNKDIILDLEIPYYVYIILIFVFLIIFVFKYINSTEEIFDFIEKNKKDLFQSFSEEETKKNLLTKLNTKINRDYLDNSKYYYEKGFNKIYENNELNKRKEKKQSEKVNNIEKVYIKRNKKVGFTNNIIYEDNNNILD